MKIKIPFNLTFAGWMLAIIVPCIILYLRPRLGLGLDASAFLAIFAATIVMWMFSLSDEFIPSIFAIAMLLILEIAPPSAVLNGFTSEEFFMVMSVFALGAVLESSGLAQRLILMVLRFTLPVQRFFNFIVVPCGITLTGVLPSANGRVALGAPLYTNMIGLIGYAPQSLGAARLASGVFQGVTLFSGMFLTSKGVNFVVYGLLPEQVRHEFGWLYWVVATAVFGLVTLSLYMLLGKFWFRMAPPPKVDRAGLIREIEARGPMSSKEKAALAGIAIMLLAFATTGIHKIAPPWVALSILYILLALNFLTKKEFQKNINWPFLIYLGSLTGLCKVMTHVGLDTWIAGHLSFVIHYMRSDFTLFVLMLFAAITAVRFMVPNNATVAIFASILLPMADIGGVNPWILGWLILTISDSWFLPYQCTYVMEFREVLGKEGPASMSTFLKVNAMTNVIRLIAILACIPYWKELKIL